MPTYPRGPKILKGALVSIAPQNPIPNAVVFQYNPEQVTRSLQPQVMGGESSERSETIRFKGAPVQTINMEVEIDAADQLERDDPTVLKFGIHPQLSAIELLAYPPSEQVTADSTLLQSGTIEIIPNPAPRILLVWGPRRILPVLINNFSITEEAFDVNLNPIRASVTLDMRVITYSDVSVNSDSYFTHLNHQISMEIMSQSRPDPSLDSVLGVNASQL